MVTAKICLSVRDIHRGKHVQMKLQCLKNSMNMDIWVVGTSNQLSIRVSWTETNFSKKQSSYSAKLHTLLKVHFALPIAFVLTLLAYENITFSILALLTKNITPAFGKWFSILWIFFSNLKCSKYCDCFINMPVSQMNGYFENNPWYCFRRSYAFSTGFKIKPLRKSIFLC